MKPASTGGLLRSQESPKNSIKVDMDSIPIFLRGGHIVPRQERARRSSLQMQGDPFTLIVALNDTAAASGDCLIFWNSHFMNCSWSLCAFGHFLQTPSLDSPPQLCFGLNKPQRVRQDFSS